MLIIAAGSVCDVCLEPFGRDLKGPCTIPCGHIFCADCLSVLTRSACPLCRTLFDRHSHIKLHIDVGNVASPVQTVAEAEARRFQGAINGLITEGSSETRLLQLITECRSFLRDQPRALFTDLRASYRMITYLHDTKTQLRTQKQAMDILENKLFVYKDKTKSPLSLLPRFKGSQPKSDPNEDIPETDDQDFIFSPDDCDQVGCNSVDHPVSCQCQLSPSPVIADLVDEGFIRPLEQIDSSGATFQWKAFLAFPKHQVLPPLVLIGITLARFAYHHDMDLYRVMCSLYLIFPVALVLLEWARNAARNATRAWRKETLREVRLKAERWQEEARRREEASMREAELRRREEELSRREEETLRLREEARRREAETRKREAEARKKAEEARRKEEEARKREEELMKLEEEIKRREEDARRPEEARKQEEEERWRRDDAGGREAAEEEMRRTVEKREAAEEEMRRAVEKREAERRKREMEERREREAEERWKRDTEERRKEEEEERKQEQEARRQNKVHGRQNEREAELTDADIEEKRRSEARLRQEPFRQRQREESWQQTEGWAANRSTAGVPSWISAKYASPSSTAPASSSQIQPEQTYSQPPHNTSTGSNQGTPEPLPNAQRTKVPVPPSRNEGNNRRDNQAKAKQEKARLAARKLEAERQRAKEITQLILHHERTWVQLHARATLEWNDFPWPMIRRPASPDDITPFDVAAYISSPHYPEKERWNTQKDRIKEHIKRWHPDRFETKYLVKVLGIDQVRVQEGAGAVARILNDLLAQS